MSGFLLISGPIPQHVPEIAHAVTIEPRPDLCLAASTAYTTSASPPVDLTGGHDSLCILADLQPLSRPKELASITQMPYIHGRVLMLELLARFAMLSRCAASRDS